MLLSMTGYGRGESTYGNRKYRMEIKSLNGKITDLRIKIPARFREKEMELRKEIVKGANRGKLEVTFSLDNGGSDEEFDLNTQLFSRYVSQLKSLSEEEGIEGGDLISSVLRFPNVIQAVSTEISEEEWLAVSQALGQALANLASFRIEEGEAMELAIRGHVAVILKGLENIAPFEKERIDRIRQRLKRGLQEHMNGEQVDENRFEQEVLFYLEKLDITEEKVRLAQHCEYFITVLDLEEDVKGKKLNFIAQEMGREINTLGAKAQSTAIQKNVVTMKDELEKIKEMLANTI